MNTCLPILSRSDFEARIRFFYESESINKLYAPEYDDLYFLYALTREKCVTSILEYGLGWSSLALNIALEENFESFSNEFASNTRHPNLWQHMIIDGSENYLTKSIARIQNSKTRVIPVHSIPRLNPSHALVIAEFDFIPNFAADLTYIDGPDDDQIVGMYKGFEYGRNFTPPVLGDLLRIEHLFWPESIIVTDGRIAQARFLRNNFKRSWNYYHDTFGDRVILRLEEPPFGEVSRNIQNLRFASSRIACQKERPEIAKY